MKAIVFIDVQNDFVKGGKLAFGYPAEDNLQKVVNFANECAADPKCKIYATRDTHEATKDEVIDLRPGEAVIGVRDKNGIAHRITGYMSTLEGEKLPVEHCIEGTDGWQIVDQLMDVLLGKATFINKPTFGSYDLVGIIEEDTNGTLDEIVICGYDLAICIISNALLLRAKYPNVKITIKKDLCGCISEETFNAALCVAKCCQIDIE